MRSLQPIIFAVIVLALHGVAIAQLSPQPTAKTTVEPELVGLSGPRLQRLTDYLEEQVTQGHMAGAVVAIARQNETAYLRAFGYRDADRQQPMPIDAVFDLSTLTQPIVAAGALVVQEQGKWLLSDPLDFYLKEFTKRKLTLLNLMRHSAALPETIATPKASAIKRSRIRHSLAAAMSFTGRGFSEALGSSPDWRTTSPVSRQGYSYDVLGLAMEHVSDQTLGALLLKELFVPLDMWSTGFNPGNDLLDRVVSLANPAIESAGKPPERDLTQPVSFDCGGACLYASAEDYLRFAMMLLNNGQLNSKRVMSRTSVKYMTTDRLGGIENRHQMPDHLPSRRSSSNGFGLGVVIHNAKSEHALDGSDGEFGLAAPTGPYFWVDPSERMAVVVLTVLSEPTRQARFHRVVRTLVRQSIND